MILKWNGRPISHDEAVNALREIIRGRTKRKRIVLTAGL
jgi:2-oxoglutarate ferredoxin oxidoreductase subunit alpha